MCGPDRPLEPRTTGTGPRRWEGGEARYIAGEEAVETDPDGVLIVQRSHLHCSGTSETRVLPAHAAPQANGDAVQIRPQYQIGPLRLLGV